MARLSSALLASAALAAAVAAQECAPSQTACAADDNLLLRCDGTTWSTFRCASDQYCMTMMPGMVHCMLRPDGAKPKPTPTPTSNTSSKPTDSSTTAPSSTSVSKPLSSTTKDSGAAANKAAAFGMGVVAVALAALF
ncbi:hypothetical protein GGI00_000419 [Coemansia sp. RSA 2681]|nr:hypothetical protein GGI00_000419 [Coemansia sp. RSA 2681]